MLALGLAVFSLLQQGGHHRGDTFRTDPDFVKLGECFSIKTFRATWSKELKSLIIYALNLSAPVLIVLIEVPIEKGSEASP